jgi:hypothetical protein
MAEAGSGTEPDEVQDEQISDPPAVEQPEKADEPEAPSEPVADPAADDPVLTQIKKLRRSMAGQKRHLRKIETRLRVEPVQPTESTADTVPEDPLTRLIRNTGGQRHRR